MNIVKLVVLSFFLKALRAGHPWIQEILYKSQPAVSGSVGIMFVGVDVGTYAYTFYVGFYDCMMQVSFFAIFVWILLVWFLLYSLVHGLQLELPQWDLQVSCLGMALAGWGSGELEQPAVPKDLNYGKALGWMILTEQSHEDVTTDRQENMFSEHRRRVSHLELRLCFFQRWQRLETLALGFLSTSTSSHGHSHAAISIVMDSQSRNNSEPGLILDCCILIFAKSYQPLEPVSIIVNLLKKL